MAKKRYYDKEMYAGKDERRRMEYEDSMMIKEDKMAMANLPQEVMIKAYPVSPYGPQDDLNDTIRGVDEQMYKDTKGNRKRGSYPEKY